MSVSIKRTSAVGSLSITPLIDVVFLLLIFFLVSSRFSEEERELDLNLPSVTQALPAMAQPHELIVNIDQVGRYYINGAFRQLEQVEQILYQAKSNNPLTQTVVIRADKQTQCEPMLAVIGLCKKVGINEYTATIDEN